MASKIETTLQLVDGIQAVSLGGAANDQAARTLIFGGFGATLVGVSLGVLGVASVAKGMVVVGLGCVAGGFLRGFRQGMKLAIQQEEAIREMERQTNHLMQQEQDDGVLFPDAIIVARR